MEKPVEIPIAASTPHISLPPTLWERVSNWVADNKAVVRIVAGVIVVVTSAGAVYYFSREARSPAHAPKLSKEERRKRRGAEAKESGEKTVPATSSNGSQPDLAASVESLDEVPEVDDFVVLTLTEDQRDQYSKRLKTAGNLAYGSKDYNEAISLYTKAILCKANDAVFYGNRAAAYNALGEYQKVIDDCTAALNLKPEYSKALNRRATAYENLKMFNEALLDYTALCIIDSFANASTAKSVEDLLKKVADQKAKDLIARRTVKLPSYIFVEKYLQSFRIRPRPEGIRETDDVPEDTGKGQLRLGLLAEEKQTREGYEEARKSFDRALELGALGEFEGLAYNMRGTYRCLLGQHQAALDDFSKAIALDPKYTQCYVKRASVYLEQGLYEEAEKEFQIAVEQNPDDPDIYYHRAHAHFIKTDYSRASQDYQKSIDLDRDFVYSHIQLALALCKMGSIASAMANFRRCVKNFPNVPDVYNYYGELLRDQGQINEAIEKFDTAIEMEQQTKPMGMNVLPIINKAWTLYELKRDPKEVEVLCEKALIIDPECDIAVATLAQLLLENGKVVEALKYFERAAELGRTEAEISNALSYAEATRTQLTVQEKYPSLAAKIQSGAPDSEWLRPS